MSWETALKEAEKWLVLAGVLAGKIKGQYFDLHEKGDTLPEKLGYRIMVVRAAKRLLEKRGAKAWMPETGE